MQLQKLLARAWASFQLYESRLRYFLLKLTRILATIASECVKLRVLLNNNKINIFNI